MIREVATRTGALLPVVGLGTYGMGEDPARRAAEVAALRLGLDLGMALVDTAEMYADGGAEEVVGEALEGRRDEVFVVSKVLPENASQAGTLRACEQSLRRLRTDRIDLYLLHWDGPHPLAETVAAFEQLRAEGKLVHWGVSNLDLARMEELEQVVTSGQCAADQVLYALNHRGIERNLLPWCRERGIVVMAYSPLDQGRLAAAGRALEAVAARHEATPAQVALAWVLREPGVVAIPKSGDERHVRENAAAARIRLSEEDLRELDREHPAPDRDVPLETL